MNVDVCSSWHGTAKENFNFTNQNTVASTVSAVANQTWPFVQASPVTVPAKVQGGGPGSVAMQLADLPNGTYTYQVTGCITGGQAKTVTIP